MPIIKESSSFPLIKPPNTIEWQFGSHEITNMIETNLMTLVEFMEDWLKNSLLPQTKDYVTSVKKHHDRIQQIAKRKPDNNRLRDAQKNVNSIFDCLKPEQNTDYQNAAAEYDKKYKPHCQIWTDIPIGIRSKILLCFFFFFRFQ